MAHDGVAQNQFSDRAQISKTFQEQDQPEVSSSLPSPAMLMEVIDKAFPYGHPAFNDRMLAMMKLHSDKNAAYAKGGAALGNFTRMASLMQNYPNFSMATPQGVAIAYLLKHFDKIMWDLNNGKAPSQESIGDLVVYFNILACMEEDRLAE